MLHYMYIKIKKDTERQLWTVNDTRFEIKAKLHEIRYNWKITKKKKELKTTIDKMIRMTKTWKLMMHNRILRKLLLLQK